MFTGIITHLGKISGKTDASLTIQTDPSLIKLLAKGTSVAVDGICLTVVTIKGDTFSIDYMPETAKRTTIQASQEGSLVNLELPATSETFLAGHIVQGHIDAVGKLVSLKGAGNSRILTFSLPQTLNKYIVEKGSIAVNGISLTVIDVQDAHFTVGIIPHTWEKTMLHTITSGTLVNIEVDILAKYLEKLTLHTTK